MRATHKGLGVKFAGQCEICGTSTGTREFEKAQTALYKRDDGKFVVVHPICVGGKTKGKVNGGTAYRVAPPDTIEVED